LIAAAPAATSVGLAQGDMHLPPILAWDFYPNGVTHDNLVAQLPQAVKKTGAVTTNQTWSGTIHITGDLTIERGATVIILPGTVVLIAAHSDDQHAGPTGEIDEFNPKDPIMVGVELTSFHVQGTLMVLGSASEPVIFTSDADAPSNLDLGEWGFDTGSHVLVNRAIIEFPNTISIHSPDVIVRQSILRNMLQAIVIGCMGPETSVEQMYSLTPTLTQNYVYNTGRHSISVRVGSPTITHNVILARPDMETTGWEHSAYGTDVPTCAVVHHNYIMSDQPQPYDGEVAGRYEPYTTPDGAGLNGMCSEAVFEYNTITGSPCVINATAGPFVVQHNNIVPTVDVELAESRGMSYPDKGVCMSIGSFTPAPGDPWQEVFIDAIGGVPLVTEFAAPHNYWGTDEPAEIESCLVIGQGVPGLHINYEPFETAFIEEALPDWRQFDWTAPLPDNPCVARTANTVNLRSGPGTGFSLQGVLGPDQYVGVQGQIDGADGYAWWQLAPELWVRSDVVETTGACEQVPVITDRVN
jgi:hypothetical protein